MYQPGMFALQEIRRYQKERDRALVREMKQRQRAFNEALMGPVGPMGLMIGATSHSGGVINMASNMASKYSKRSTVHTQRSWNFRR